MEKSSTLISNVFSNGREYIHLKGKSLQLEAYDKLSSLVAVITNGLIISVLSIVALLFINIGFGFGLSVLFDSYVWGFLALGGIYLIAAVIFILARKTIQLKVQTKLIAQLSDQQYADYEAFKKDRKQIKAELDRSETLIKGNADELKENLEILAEDFKRLKADVHNFRHLFSFEHEGEEASRSEKKSGEKDSKKEEFRKLAFSGIAELLINKFVMRDVSSLKKLIWPTLAKVIINKGLSPEANKDTKKGENTGFMTALKNRLADFISSAQLPIEKNRGQ